MALNGHLTTILICVTFFCFLLADASNVSENTFRNLQVNTSHLNDTEGHIDRIFNESSNDYVIHDSNDIFECSCGWQSRGCHLENGKKVCDCDVGYAQKGDECRSCNCGFASTRCHFNENGQINCTCIYGFAQTSYGDCKWCDCGTNVKKCEFQGYRKICMCDDGYIETDGKCKLCDCGFRSSSCRFDWSGVRKCTCESGYVSKRRNSYDEDEVCKVYTEITGWKIATYIESAILCLIILLLLIIIWTKRTCTC